MMLEASTIVELLCRRIETDGPRPALGIKQGENYRWYTWQQVAEQISQTVAMLVELGVQPGDRVVHVAENRREWVITDFAIQLAGAIHVPIHPTLAGPQIAWQVRHSGARLALLSGPEQVTKLTQCGAELPGGVRWIAYDACDQTLGGQPIARFSELANTADGQRGQEAACQARQAARPAALTTILYTSGTTGEPKGVMLTQGNLATNACSTVAAFGYQPDQVRINLLPLSHIFARTCDLYAWLAEGSQLALAESRETVLADCALVHPTCLNAVPYFYDKLYRGLAAKGLQDQPGIVRAALGGAMKTCCAGGAALPEHLYDYYLAQGIPVLQGYGLSESSPVITISTPDQHRRGSCGRAIPGVEIRIAPDGEILTRGPHVMPGYYQNPAATAEILTAGWLATGDLGRQDDDGFLYITGRKKEILVTSGGKNIAPVYLESLLTQDPLIAQAMILGDGRSYLTALIVPNFEALELQLQQQGLGALAGPQMLHDPAVIAIFSARINDRLACVSPHEQVRKFHLLPRPFAIETGELTPKLSLRRQEITSRYAAEVAALYATNDGERR